MRDNATRLVNELVGRCKHGSLLSRWQKSENIHDGQVRPHPRASLSDLTILAASIEHVLIPRSRNLRLESAPFVVPVSTPQLNLRIKVHHYSVYHHQNSDGLGNRGSVAARTALRLWRCNRHVSFATQHADPLLQTTNTSLSRFPASVIRPSIARNWNRDLSHFQTTLLQISLDCMRQAGIERTEISRIENTRCARRGCNKNQCSEW